MMKNFKSRMVLILCITPLFFGLSAQNSYIKWIATPFDEAITLCRPIEGSSHFVSCMMRGTMVENPNQYSEYFDYKHFICIMDEEFEILDSLDISRDGAYRLVPYNIVIAQEDLIVIKGNALDTLTLNHKSFLYWLTADLDSAEVTYYGEDGIDYLTSRAAAVNHTGHVVLAQCLPPKGVNQAEATCTFYEVDMQGNIVLQTTQPGNSYNYDGIYDCPSAQRYVFTMGNLFHYDYQFMLDTMVPVVCDLCFQLKDWMISSDELLFYGEIVREGPPPETFKDLCILRVNMYSGVTDTAYYGVPDTNDRNAELGYKPN
jgi:hypothetical protein